MDEYDLLIYPGFMRRPMARWNEDGSCAPMARARGPKGEAFQLMLKPSEIDEDISHIEHEVSGALRDASARRVIARCRRGANDARLEERGKVLSFQYFPVNRACPPPKNKKHVRRG